MAVFSAVSMAFVGGAIGDILAGISPPGCGAAFCMSIFGFVIPGVFPGIIPGVFDGLFICVNVPFIRVFKLDIWRHPVGPRMDKSTNDANTSFLKHSKTNLYFENKMIELEGNTGKSNIRIDSFR